MKAFFSEAMALKSGIILMSISLAYKSKVPVTCTKNVLYPFESGVGVVNGLGILHICSIIRGDMRVGLIL